jgi:hypothetical protein
MASQTSNEELPFLSGFADIFADGNENSRPLVLLDGTSVQWPRGWTENDALAWREARALTRQDQQTRLK